MSTAAQLFATPLPLVLEDTTYQVMRITQRVKAIYEQRLAEAYLNAVQSRRQQLGNDYTEVLAAAFCDLAAGRLAWGSARCWDSLKQDDNFAFLMRLLLSKYHPLMTVEEVAELVDQYPDEWTALFQELLKKKQDPTPGSSQSTSTGS